MGCSGNQLLKYFEALIAKKGLFIFIIKCPIMKFKSYCFNLIFSVVPTDPEFLSGGGCRISSSPIDSHKAGSVKTKTKAYTPLRLLFSHSALLSYPRAWSEITSNSNAHTPTLYTCAHIHTETHRHCSSGNSCLLWKTWKSLFHVM